MKLNTIVPLSSLMSVIHLSKVSPVYGCAAGVEMSVKLLLDEIGYKSFSSVLPPATALYAR